MWTAILYAYHNQLPGHLQVRLQSVQNWASTHTSCSHGSSVSRSIWARLLSSVHRPPPSFTAYEYSLLYNKYRYAVLQHLNTVYCVTCTDMQFYSI
ncbi:hypothetical protein DPMN_036346 [Dreissena polymorpha]|uniref:Uncharacterized protein n=1 Tax=Dreissena polymorpha TaxID=45954 RepID=A0A9D4RNT0_DREPO|nr:hypothetical protein DPMN_036346 [Dreissena polymorpha]